MEITVEYIDAKGKIYIWSDESAPSPLKSSNSHNLYELSGQKEDYEIFSYVKLKHKV